MKTEYDFSKMNSCKNPYASRMNNPVHPGLLLKEWIPEGMTVAEAALQLGITRAMLSNILDQTAGVSTEMALRLSEWLGTTPEMWTEHAIIMGFVGSIKTPKPTSGGSQSVVKQCLTFGVGLS